MGFEGSCCCITATYRTSIFGVGDFESGKCCCCDTATDVTAVCRPLGWWVLRVGLLAFVPYIEMKRIIATLKQYFVRAAALSYNNIVYKCLCISDLFVWNFS